jgi:hypothetical protein
MIIEQTVLIPPDHRLTIDVPREVPAGKVMLSFTPVANQTPSDRKADIANEVGSAPENADEGTSPHPNSDALFALFAPIRGTVDVDEIRTERILAKHLK